MQERHETNPGTGATILFGIHRGVPGFFAFRSGQSIGSAPPWPPGCRADQAAPAARAQGSVCPQGLVYPFPEILLLFLCASIAAADDFVEVQHWRETHMDFLRRFLPYKHGIPSHDALNDLMNALDLKLFSECFITRVNGLHDGDLDVVTVDGKTPRHCHAMSKVRQVLHMVSAGTSGQRLVLGQEPTDSRSCCAQPDPAVASSYAASQVERRLSAGHPSEWTEPRP
jgi:hypothetical protein